MLKKFNHMKPQINIAIPIYNGSLTILETIQSVADQTYKNWVINIYDNNSSDKSIKLISTKYTKLISEGKIKIHLNDGFITQAQNWNRCLNEIKSFEYFKLLCADDILEPNHLEVGIKALSKTKNDVAAFSSSINYIDEESNIFGFRSYGFFKIEFWLSLFYRNYLGCPSAMIIKTNTYKGYTFSEIPYVGDLIFFMEFYLDDKIFIFTKKPSASFRVTSTSDTGRSYGTREMILGRREFRKLIIKTMKVKGLCKLFLFAFNLLITAAEKFYFTARKTLKSLK